MRKKEVRQISSNLFIQFGAFNRDRTGDLILTMDALYLLSYKGVYFTL